MSELLTAPFWVAVAEIILINILLSGDNAIVIALACRNLPERQRRLGVLGGVVGAVVARVLLTAFAASLLALPYLKLVGAVLLLWIGVQLIAATPDDEPEVHADERLWSAIYTVVTADLIMSLDNVVGVAAAAHGSVPLLVFGLVVSIPIVVFGSQVVMRLFERLPWLIVAGGGLLGYVAGEMATRDPALEPALEPFPWAHWAIPVAGVGLIVAVGLALRRREAQAAP